VLDLDTLSFFTNFWNMSVLTRLFNGLINEKKNNITTKLTIHEELRRFDVVTTAYVF